MKRSTIIIILTVAISIIAAGPVQRQDSFEIIRLEGDGFKDITHTAAFTRVPGVGDVFWLFYPSVATIPTSRPIILWLDGVTGTPPSLFANFGMFGPLDFNLNKRQDSWIEEYNLLFVDAPVGTGFSKAEDNSNISGNLDENAKYLLYTIESFYKLHEEYANAPLYIIGQGHGSQLAITLGLRLVEPQTFTNNFKGVVIGNGILSPGLVLTQLDFYLEGHGYVDANARNAIKNFSTDVNNFINNEQFENAFDLFLSLGQFINENAGATAVNLNYITEKLSRTSIGDSFGVSKYLQDIYRIETDLYKFMDETVAPILGIPNTNKYDEQRISATRAFRSSFMKPAVDKVEHLLQTTNVTVSIYNGNLDAVSNTPGQLQWVENLQWPGQDCFLNSPRSALVVNSRLEGYFRQTARLQFYWMNAAGQSVPLDSPAAMKRVLQMITSK